MTRAVIPLPIPNLSVDNGVRDTVHCIGLIGRLTPWKGQDVFLRAFAQAFPNDPIRARIVGSALFGEDDYAGSLRSLAHELKIADRVDFVGFRNDVAAELAQMDIAVNASILPETFGQTIVEALSVAVPTISPQAGGPAGYIVDTVNGLLHPPGDVDALAAAMRRLASDRHLRERLAREGLPTARHFSPESTSAQFVGFYRTVIERRGGPPRRQCTDFG